MKFLPLILCFFFSLLGNAQVIDEIRLKNHIYYLASDKLEGRLPGSEGETLAYTYIEKEFNSYGLVPKGENGYLQVFSYTYHSNPHDTLETNGISRTGTNVIAYLNNHSDKTVIIGAHYDHLGMGMDFNSLDKNRGYAVHNGADDNASGTAGVLELARNLSENNVQEKSNYLFICFSAEEDGLIGSKYFTNNPTVDLSKVSYMINMDMIGRLNESTQSLMVYGIGTSPEFEPNFPTQPKNLNLVTDSAGIGPSDHTSFYLKEIPVLFFFTGQHADYHKSTDDAEKINFAGQKRVLNFILETIMNLDKKEKLAFTPVKLKKQEQRVELNVSLGIMPDYTYEGKGLRMDAVIEDKPAEKAGMKDGDVIILIDKTKIEDIYDYMDGLAKYNIGDSAMMKVVRNKAELDLKVIF